MCLHPVSDVSGHRDSFLAGHIGHSSLSLLTGLLLSLSGAVGHQRLTLLELAQNTHESKKKDFSQIFLPYFLNDLCELVQVDPAGSAEEAATSHLQLCLFSKLPLEGHWVEPQKRTRTMWQ